MLKARKDALYVNIDIPPVAAVSSWYLSRVFGTDAVMTYEKTRDLESIDIDKLPAGVRALVLCPWQLPRLTGSFDLFINFVSFQEMEPHVVKNYIDLVQPLTRQFVLLRNSVKGKKVVKDGKGLGVLEATTVEDMLESFGDFEVIGRDADTFGAHNKKSGFKSEVVAMRRRASSGAHQ